MTYEEIRQHVQEHFRELLEQVKDQVRVDGKPDDLRLDALRATEGLAGGDPETWLSILPESADGLLRGFCARRGIAEAELTEANRRQLLRLLQDGHGSLAHTALNHISALAHIDLSEPSVPATSEAAPATKPLESGVPGKSVAEVSAIYFDEIRRTAPVEPKTELDRKEVLELLDEIVGQKPIAAISKSDAQEVKKILLRLPWNRNKMPATRGKTLAEMLQVPGVRVISARRVTTHLGNLHAFFKWAVANGYTETNVFDGMQIKASKKSREDDREAFSAEQLQLMFLHLTENPTGRVRKDVHKWGTLIGMFSGMRVNEVAQLEVADIKQDGGTWYFDVTKVGDENKSLKTLSSERRLPIHRRLIGCGLLDYIAEQQRRGETRVFPELSYTEMNHYGRNLGRWVNETFLPELGLKKRQLVYHSFRHTMATRLAQAGAPEKHVPAILGHRQVGITYSTYLKDGFLPAQLKSTIDLFDF